MPFPVGGGVGRARQARKALRRRAESRAREASKRKLQAARLAGRAPARRRPRTSSELLYRVQSRRSSPDVAATHRAAHLLIVASSTLSRGVLGLLGCYLMSSVLRFFLPRPFALARPARPESARVPRAAACCAAPDRGP